MKLFGRPVYRGRRAAPKAPEKRSRRSSKATWWPGTRFAWGVLRRVTRSLRLRARVLGRVGTGDPATTATVRGILVAAASLFRRLDARSLRVDWMEPALDLEGRLDGRLRPAAIVWIVASEYAQSRWSRRTTEVMG